MTPGNSPVGQIFEILKILEEFVLNSWVFGLFFLSLWF